MNILKDMLLIEEASVYKLYQEMMNIAGYLVAPMFTIALILEYFGEMRFGEVIKRLLIVTIFMTFFYQIHTEGTKLALEGASYTLKKVNPRNLFVKKWNSYKVVTKKQSSWGRIESFLIPNLNDLVATTFFVLTKIFIWFLKLTYSTVYHFAYVFSGVTAILYFFGWTKDALKGTVQASIWCFLTPFVVIAILILIGNTIDEKALAGDLLIAQVDTIVWLFGINFLLLLSPAISYGILKGDGFQTFGTSVGKTIQSAAPHALLAFSQLRNVADRGFHFGKKLLFNPSIADQFRADRKKKEKLLNKSGGLRNPFKQDKETANMEESLEQMGISKEEAKEIVKTHDFSKSKNQKSRGRGGVASTNRKTPDIDLEKQTFLYNEDYWNSIDDSHKQSIKKKYNIETDTPVPNHIYRINKEPIKIPERRAKAIIASDQIKRLKAHQKGGRDEV